MGVEVSPLRLNIKKEEKYIQPIFNIWDTAGQEQFEGNRDGYLIGAQAVIIMFDVTSKASYKGLISHWNIIQKICPEVPIVLCGNKCDSKNRKVLPREITFHTEHKIPYFEISNKSCYNFEKPLLYILKKLYNSENVFFW